MIKKGMMMLAFTHKKVSGLLLTGMMMVAGCGQMSQNDADVQQFKGSGKHVIVGEDINVRNEDLSTVLFTVSSGAKMTPTGAKKSGLGNVFHKVTFDDGRSGWVADAAWVQPVGAAVVATGAPRIVVNITTNRLTFFKGTTVVRSWNVGSARAGKSTPVGSYTVKIKQKCPTYYGSEGNKNVPGCSAANPLGTRALWFIDTMYGLHGTSQPELIAEGTTAAGRLLSAGCVRNANANIEWLFDQVVVGTPIQIVK